MWGKSCKMIEDLFYVAPKDSLQFILKNGILPPYQVNKLIEQKELPREVLGVSYGMDSSNFPEHVSLLHKEFPMKFVAEQICHNRTGRYNDPDFMAIGFLIDGNISKDKAFVNSEKVKQMNSDSYPGEILYKGPIDVKHIMYYFAVRTWD